MARFRSPITGRFVNLAAARRWNYASESEFRKPPRKIPSEIDEEIVEVTEFEDDFFFEDAEDLEEFEFFELEDLDELFVDFMDDIFEEFEDVEETDYEEVV